MNTMNDGKIVEEALTGKLDELLYDMKDKEAAYFAQYVTRFKT